MPAEDIAHTIETMTELRAGVARRSVDPPLGIRTGGYSSRDAVVESIDEPLSVTVLVLSGLGSMVAIAAIDLCMVPQDIAREWRAAIAGALGCDIADVLINLSHTHSAGALLRTQPEFADQADLLTTYQAMLVERLVEAALAAAGSLQPARIGAGSGTSHIGVQRREHGPDGYVFLGEVPDGSTDPMVGVVRVDDLTGRPIAILASYGCHTVTVGPNARVASPDFPGPMRRMVEETLGGLCLFLQGGGGDVMPCWGMAHEPDGRDNKERIGWMLGGEVVRVAATIRTAVRRGERVWTASLNGPGLTMRPLVPVDGPTCTALAARTATVSLDLVELPTMSQALALHAERVSDLRVALASGDERPIRIARRFVAWSEVMLHAVETGDRTRTVEVQAIRINDIVFTAIAAEVFSATTTRIRAMSPISSTIALGYTNGIIGYLPTADAYPAAGWDITERYRVPDLVFQAYLLPTALAPDSEVRVVDAVLVLISDLVAL